MDKRTKSIVATFFGLAAVLTGRAVAPIVDADFSSVLRGGAAAGVSMADGGDSSNGDTGDDDARRSRKGRLSNEHKDSADLDDLTNHWLFKKIIKDQTQQGSLLKVYHAWLVDLKNTMEGKTGAKMKVLTAYDEENDRYRLTLRTVLPAIGDKDQPEMWHLYESKIWFNADNSISLEHYANKSVDLGYWDKIHSLGKDEKIRDYSREEFGHPYLQIDLTLMKVVEWIGNNSKYPVQNKDIQTPLAQWLKPIGDRLVKNASDFDAGKLKLVA